MERSDFCRVTSCRKQTVGTGGKNPEEREKNRSRNLELETLRRKV